MTDHEVNNEMMSENNEQEKAAAGMEGKKYREFNNHFVKIFWLSILALIPISGILFILRIHQALSITLYSEQYLGWFLGLMLCGVFMGVPAGKRHNSTKVPFYDWILAVLSLIVGFYIAFNYANIAMQLGVVTTERIILSVTAVLLVIEAIRRILGYTMLIVVSLFIAYGFLAPYLPGVLQGRETSPEQLFNYLYLDPNSILGLVGIAATIVLSFIFFGQILLFFNGSNMLNDFALSAFGRFRGGPAKGAIVGSSLVGTITGGPVANISLTGNLTIPMMKRNGYTSAQAGAVESVASTGGQIMPPVMGVAAFIIAETLGVPYTEVALAALIPAILFYLCLFFQVDFIAGRSGMNSLSKKEVPSMKNALKNGWVLIPILGALIYFLFFVGYTPQKAGIYASGIAFICLGLQTKSIKQIIRSFPVVLPETGKVLLEIGTVLAAAGIVVGITGITGLGFNMGMVLLGVADYGLFFLLLICAIVSIVLGMGMPSVAAYTLVAVMVAPAMVEFGVAPIAAHLFVFYFAIVSNYTPPIAMACFVAGPIAKENAYRIAFQSLRLGIIAFIVPFLFVYSPEMLIRTEMLVPWHVLLITIGTAIIASFILAMALEGFLLQKVNNIKRVFLVGIAVLLFIPASVWELGWLLNTVGFVLAVLFFLNEWRIRAKKDRYEAKPSSSPSS